MNSFTRKDILVDENLSKILEVPAGSYVSFAEVTKKVYEYIKVNDLRKREDKKQLRTNKFCFQCGAKLPSKAKFCDKCGRRQ